MRRRSLRKLNGDYAIVLKDKSEIYATIIELDESRSEAFLIYRPIPQEDHASMFQWPEEEISSRLIRKVY